MEGHIFIVPRKLDIEAAFKFVEELHLAPEAKEYIFDFSILKWIEPFSMLYISCAIAGFSRSKLESGISVRNYENNACDYASHMGFFKSFRIDHGNRPGEAINNLNYVPITIIRVDSLKEDAQAHQRPVGEVIESKAEEYAKILTRQQAGPLVDTIKFALREMMRNVVEHSHAEKIGFCAQYWPARNMAELSILDTGRGLKASLLRNPYLEKTMNDADAINYALLPGISGVMFEGKYSNPYDEWENSGYGLYMASEICRNGGDFVICSGVAGMRLEATTKKYYTSTLGATAIRMRLDTSMLKPAKDSLAEYRRKGERVARQIYGANLSASTASSMLTRDFEGE